MTFIEQLIGILICVVGIGLMLAVLDTDLDERDNRSDLARPREDR